MCHQCILNIAGYTHFLLSARTAYLIPKVTRIYVLSGTSSSYRPYQKTRSNQKPIHTGRTVKRRVPRLLESARKVHKICPMSMLSCQVSSNTSNAELIGADGGQSINSALPFLLKELLRTQFTHVSLDQMQPSV